MMMMIMMMMIIVMINSLSVGARGPLLLQDHVLIEELAHFDRERIPERVVHAKGAGAFGYFEVFPTFPFYNVKFVV